ncbi:MAG: phosphoketolase family protein [Actinomycetota bacterium]
MPATPLSSDRLAQLDAHWRAANYLAVGQIYLLDNPLLREPLTIEHIKPRLLGHFGTTPGLNLVYTHLNRAIVDRDQDMVMIAGPGHGGPAMVACTWLEGTYSEVYPNIGHHERGMQRLFKQFSFPGGIPSHHAPETPGSIHEGGELGYSLSHATGAALDNPDLVVACVIGDGEAETGPLSTSWMSSAFINPQRDGAVLPILALNGYKIANPTVLARIGDERLEQYMRATGWEPHWVSGDDPEAVHQQMADVLDTCLDKIADIKATGSQTTFDQPWPMIVMRTPKGWTGPKVVDGVPVEGTWRAHQVPLAGVRENPEHLQMLEDWMKSYRPEELFDDGGAPVGEITSWLPHGDRRLGSNPHANGGKLRIALEIPDFRHYGVAVDQPGRETSEPTRVLGRLLRDVMEVNADRQNFRLFGPDETASNRLDAVYEVSGKTWHLEELDTDVALEPDGRVMEMLSEHQCQGWLEGYLLTGRHGLFSCYEAFIHIIDSMFNQHAKWLKVTRSLGWREPISSLNYLLTSHVWRQDHNGFSHQDPGFVDHVVNKKAEVVRVYFPPDTNCLLSVADHCLSSVNYVNVIVSGKQPSMNWLSMDEAVLHCTRGIGIWDWASNDGGDPDVVLACAGDIPTLETIAAAQILREHIPDLKVRVVNVVDLMRLVEEDEHPHGLSTSEFDTILPPDVPIIFAYHGYPWLIHRLTYRRNGHDNMHVRGYIEEGTTTTPFDMVVRNNLDRFHLVMDVIDRTPGLGSKAALVRQQMIDERTRHHAYTREHGEDMPEIRNWTWRG